MEAAGAVEARHQVLEFEALTPHRGRSQSRDEDLAEIHSADGKPHIYLNNAGVLDTAPSWTYDSSTVGTAIAFGDLGDPESEVRELLRENYTIRRKQNLGTEPCVYYIV